MQDEDLVDETQTRPADPEKHLHSPTDCQHELCQIFDFLLFLGLCTHPAESKVARQNISVSFYLLSRFLDVTEVESISEPV